MSTPKKRKTSNGCTIEEGAKKSTGCILRMGQHYETNKSKYRLLEATPEVLKALTSGERVYFKGDETTDAVMCTATQTFKIQKVETSNTVLLVPPGEKIGKPSSSSPSVALSVTEDPVSPCSPPNSTTLPRFEVDGSTSFTFVSELVAPRLAQLQVLISKAPYGSCPGDQRRGLESRSDCRVGGDESGGEHEGDRDDSLAAMGRPTFQDLVEKVQASEGEIKSALAQCRALEIDGRWCSVETEVVEETLDALVDVIMDLDLNLNELNLKDVCDHMAPEDGSGLFDARVVRHCLMLFGDPVLSPLAVETAVAAGAGANASPSGSAGSASASQMFKLNRDKVAVNRAHSLFMQHGKQPLAAAAAGRGSGGARAWSGEGSGGGAGAGGGSGGGLCLGYDDLMEKWELKLPMETGVAFDRPHHESLLKGVAVPLPPRDSDLAIGEEQKEQASKDGGGDEQEVDSDALQPKSSREAKVFRYLPEKQLSRDPSERFAALFEVCPTWTGEALSPYLEPLVAPGVSVPALLLRHTRSITAKTAAASGGGSAGVADTATPVFCAR